MNWRTKLRALFRKEKLDADMSAEVREHLELQTAQNNMDAAQQTYVQALAAFESAKNDLIASEWAFHNLVLGANRRFMDECAVWMRQHLC